MKKLFLMIMVLMGLVFADPIIVDGYYDNCVNIQFDYREGFKGIVEHVIKVHTPKRPHMMAGIKGNKFSEERIEVFREVIETHGITFQDNMVSYGDFWAKPTIKAMKKINTLAIGIVIIYCHF